MTAVTPITHPPSPGSAIPDDPRSPAWLLMGMPDDRRARLEFRGWNEPLGFKLQGMAGFPPQLRGMPWAAQPIYLGQPGMAINAELKRLPCINMLADADIYPLALEQAAGFVEEMKVPCFNHPRAVQRITRDGVYRQLRDIPGLHVPVTVRVRAQTLDALRAAMVSAGITYPVLVRMAGDHSGVSTVKVDGDGAWDAIHPLPWGGRDVYLTQYADYQDADGCFRKMRLVVAGDRVIGRHLMISGTWMVHARNRLPGSQVEEGAWLAGFNGLTLARIEATVLEMARRLELDFFGIDASLRPDGTLLLFEANPCMSVFHNPGGTGPTIWDGCIQDMTQSLIASLWNVASWRHVRALLAGADARPVGLL